LDPKSAPQLCRRIQRDRKTAERELTLCLRRLANRELAVKWRVALGLDGTTAPGDGGRRRIPQATQRKVAQMATRFLTLGKKAASPGTSAGEVHRFRIASKKFRYTLELVEPFYGGGLIPWLQRVKAIQSILGDANDCETVRQMVSRWNASEGLISKLEELQKRKLRKFRREWAALEVSGAFPAVVSIKPPSKDSAAPRRAATSSSSRSASSKSASVRSAVA
jgi:CHAD domain-containing protein